MPWRQICWAHLKRDFQKPVDLGGAAAPIGEAALTVEREVFELWHRFRQGELDRPALQREMEPLQVRLWQVLADGVRGDHAKTAGSCAVLFKLWPALWRKGSFGCHSADGSRFAERMLTVAATCRQQKRNLLDFVVHANLAARLGTTPPSLVPVPAS